MRLSRLFAGLRAALAPPVNTLGNADFEYVRDSVTRQTSGRFGVTGKDYAMPNGLAISGVKKNVGIVIPQDATAPEIDRAVKFFMTALGVRGNRSIRPDEVCRYRAPKKVYGRSVAP